MSSALQTTTDKKVAFSAVKPILSRSRQFTKHYDQTVKDPTIKDLKPVPKLQIKKYCDFLEIALQDLIRQSDEMTKNDVQDLKESRRRGNRKGVREKRNLTKTRNEMQTQNAKRGWFSPTDGRLIHKRKLTKLNLDGAAWSRPLSNANRYTPGINTQDRVHASKEPSASIERFGLEDVEIEQHVVREQETEVTVISSRRSESSRTERGSSSAIPKSVYKQEPSVDLKAQTLETKTWADKRDVLDSKCQSSMAYEVPITQDIVSSDFFKTTELIGQDLYSSPKAQTRYPLTPAVDVAGSHSPAATENPAGGYKRTSVTSQDTRVQSACLTHNHKNRITKRYHRNKMPSQSINIKKQSVYFQQLYHREKYLNTHVPNSFYFRSSEDINENLEKLRKSAILQKFNNTVTFEDHASLNELQQIKQEAHYRDLMSRASMKGPPQVVDKFQADRNTVAYNTTNNFGRRTSKSKLNSLTFKKSSHFLAETQQPSSLAQSWQPNPKLNKHRQLYLKACRNSTLKADDKTLRKVVNNQAKVSQDLLKQMRNYREYRQQLNS